MSPLRAMPTKKVRDGLVAGFAPNLHADQIEHHLAERILGVDAEGRVSWLQLETSAGLAELAELAEAAGLGAAAADDIRAGRTLVDLELQQALGHPGSTRHKPAFSIGHQGGLLAALFPVELAGHAPAFTGYKQWLKKHGDRTVQD